MEKRPEGSNLNTRVLVTGASGFLGIHCVRLLLKEGYQVRGTVRNLNNPLKTQPLKCLEGSQRLELVKAELNDASSWIRAVQGCDYVMHIASPCQVVTDCSIIDDAVNGTLNVLKAAALCPQVKKVVLTSSSGAIDEGHKERKVFDETDWTNLECKHVHDYHRSKTLAEMAAWNFVKNEKGVHFKLTVLNPSVIIGPLMQNVKGASASMIGYFVDFTMPMYPALNIPAVEVEDVALAHLRAMVTPEADGQRIILTHGPLSYREIAQILRKEFGPKGYFVPRLEVPYPILLLYAIISSKARSAVRVYDRVGKLDNSKAKRILKMDFKDPRPAMVDMVYDMIDRGLLPRKTKLPFKSVVIAVSTILLFCVIAAIFY